MIKFLFKIFLALAIILICFLFIGSPKENKNMIWGINFSQKYASELSLDWREVYLALLKDMNVKNLRLAVHWDLFEKQDGNYDFSDLDWQIQQAKENKARVIPIIGMKTSRWPECHIPNWAISLNKEKQQEKILVLLEKIVSRYKDDNTIEYWQVENEPFFSFGECPWKDDEFLEKEIALVRSIDKNHKIVLSDSGEGSFWFRISKLGDILAVTTYRTAWFKEFKRYVKYPFPPSFYNSKIFLIKAFWGKEVMCGEFQSEPWGEKLTYNLPFFEQEKSMNLEKFKDNIEYIKKTKYSRVYLWGGEWMYWIKVNNYNPLIWEEAKKLFK